MTFGLACEQRSYIYSSVCVSKESCPSGLLSPEVLLEVSAAVHKIYVLADFNCKR